MSLNNVPNEAILEQINQPVRDRIESALQPEFLEIIDNSWRHAGHVSAPQGFAGGTHLAITIVSSKFEGVGMLDRHRAVHQALGDSMGNPIHALELKTWTPAEWAKKTNN